MNCHYHPETSAITRCVLCGKPLCSECAIAKEGQFYCRECFKEPIPHVGVKKMIFPILLCGIAVGIFLLIPLNVPSYTICLSAVIGGALAVILLKTVYSIHRIKPKDAVITGGLTGGLQVSSCVQGM